MACITGARKGDYINIEIHKSGMLKILGSLFKILLFLRIPGISVYLYLKLILAVAMNGSYHTAPAEAVTL